jgi:cysteinyl-tRNA synthetase
MPLYLHNNLTRKKEIFSPQKNSGEVTLYVCGPTVYDFAHLGNARAMVVFDVLLRVLKYKYAKVVYVRNITDVDDKICAASVSQQCNFTDISKKFEKEFNADMNSLGVCPPTYSPKATEFIDRMIEITARLIEKGVAYEADGHVLFDVAKYKDYGKLSKKSRDELLAGARIEVATYKKNPEDFVLWKPAIDPSWESPWGRGRPGWHIECSAMSSHFFGETFDIHAGGIDLIFPHHENERAQSCCFFEVEEMARFWLHNGHLMVNGEKMSKSLGNFFTVRDLLRSNNPETIRLALLYTHYKQPLNWTQDLLSAAKRQLDKWYRVFSNVENADVIRKSVNDNGEEKIKKNDFITAIYDDLNTPLAIQHLNKMIQSFDGNEEILREIFVCGKILGLLSQSANTWFNSIDAGADQLDMSKFIYEKILAREAARLEKNFKLADEIRNELLELGIVLEDFKGKTTWRKK